MAHFLRAATDSIGFDRVQYLSDIGDDVCTLLRQLLVIGLVCSRHWSDLERLARGHRLVVFGHAVKHRDMTVSQSVRASE